MSLGRFQAPGAATDVLENAPTARCLNHPTTEGMRLESRKRGLGPTQPFMSCVTLPTHCPFLSLDFPVCQVRRVTAALLTGGCEQQVACGGLQG